MEVAPPKAPTPRQGIIFFLLILIVMSFSLLIAGGGMSLLGVAAGGGMTAVAMTVALGLLASDLAGLALFFWYVRRTQVSWEVVAPFRPIPPRAHLWGIVGGLGVSAAWESLLAMIFPRGMGDLAEEFARFVSVFTVDSFAFLVFLISITLMTGIVEELAFRGYIFAAFRSRFSRASAVLLTSLLFALAHINPLHILAVFPTGVWLAYLVIWTGSLYPAIGFHVLNNALALSGIFTLGASSLGGASLVIFSGIGLGFWAFTQLRGVAPAPPQPEVGRGPEVGKGPEVGREPAVSTGPLPSWGPLTRVVREGGVTFRIYAKEPLDSPPHAHVTIGQREVRIELGEGTALEPISEQEQEQIAAAFAKVKAMLRAIWTSMHE